MTGKTECTPPKIESASCSRCDALKTFLRAKLKINFVPSQTHFDDSTLFYASGESHKHHHLSISIRNQSVEIELDLGSSPIKVSALESLF